MKKRIAFLIGFIMLVNSVFPVGAFAGENEALSLSGPEQSVDKEELGFDYDAVMDAVHEGLLSGNEVIDLSEFEIPFGDGSGIKKIYSDALGLFADTYSFKGTSDPDGRLLFTTKVEGEGVRTISKLSGLGYNDYDPKLFDEALEKAMDEVDPGMSDIAVLACLHDYLIQICEVSDGVEAADSSNAYGALVNHLADYEGYAKGLTMLYREAGFDSEVVRAGSDHGYNYFWTRVKLDGKCYNVDAFYGDIYQNQVRHNFFLLSDKMIAEALGESEEVSLTGDFDSFLEPAVDETYDQAFWRSEYVITPLVFVEDDIYYGMYHQEDDKHPFYIYLYKANVNEPESAGVKFYDLPTNSDYRLKSYCGLFLLEDRLYFNNKVFIYSIDLNAQNRNKVYQRPEGGPDIYFCYYVDKKPGYFDESHKPHPVEFRTDLVDDGKDDKDQEIGVVEEGGDNGGEGEEENVDDSQKPTSTELVMEGGNATMIKGTVIGVNKFISDNSVTMYSVDFDKSFIQYNEKKQTLKFKKETGAMGPTYLTINGERFAITIIKPIYVKGTNKATLLLSSGLPGCDEYLVKLPNSDGVSWGTVKYMITASAGCFYEFNSEEKKLEGVYLDEKSKGSIKVNVVCCYIDPLKNVEKKVKLGTFKVKVID